MFFKFASTSEVTLTCHHKPGNPWSACRRPMARSTDGPGSKNSCLEIIFSLQTRMSELHPFMARWVRWFAIGRRAFLPFLEPSVCERERKEHKVTTFLVNYGKRHTYQYITENSHVLWICELMEIIALDLNIFELRYMFAFASKSSIFSVVDYYRVTRSAQFHYIKHQLY